MKIKGIVLFASVILVGATSVMAGPFGLDMGMTLKDIGGQPEKIGNGEYKIVSVPKPHSAFDAYVVKVSPKSGLCWLAAIGKNISTSVYGSELRAAFNEMKARLEKSYGKYKTRDFLMPGSIWHEPRYFMEGIMKKERILDAVWDAGSTSSKLTNNIKEIVLSVNADRTGNGHVSVVYSFRNKSACEAEIAAQEDGAL